MRRAQQLLLRLHSAAPLSTAASVPGTWRPPRRPREPAEQPPPEKLEEWRLRRETRGLNTEIDKLFKAGMGHKVPGRLTAAIKAGERPTVRAFAMSAVATSHKGDWEKAIALLSEMRAANLAPTAHIYGSCIRACGNGQQPDKALALLAEMRSGVIEASAAVTLKRSSQDSSASAPSFRPPQPTAACYGNCMEALARVHRPQEAFQLLDQMAADGVAYTQAAFISAAKACAWAPDADLALNLLERMREAGIQPSKRAQLLCIKACADAKRSDDAEALFDALTAEGHHIGEGAKRAVLGEGKAVVAQAD